MKMKVERMQALNLTNLCRDKVTLVDARKARYLHSYIAELLCLYDGIPTIDRNKLNIIIIKVIIN